MSSKQGVVGIFADPHELIDGAVAARRAGHQNLDAFTPYPIHGIDKVLGIKKSWISVVTLLFGLLGCFGGLGFQIWTSAVAWPVNVGGKPMLSIPAFIPITFESTILLGGVMTFIGVLSFCGLPKWKGRIVDPRVSADAFALWVPVRESQQISHVEKLMKENGAYEVRVVT
ncbi:MAG: DUF3341 domain-containing protein [Deltaproteobacteria bacterium]|nr:DUF3341 domain-containing protein [Deltaproteobacteria bacterium]